MIDEVAAVDPKPGTTSLPMFESFESFYALEFRRVLGLLSVLTGSQTNAEELTQEAFARAFRDWSRVQRLESPGGWVRRVAVNQACSLRRRAATELRHRDRLRESEVSTDPDRADDWLVWSEVRKLPRRQAQAVALRFIDELSVAEIARVLECSVDTAKTHLARGRTTLARRLEALR